jgi:hypothetical protein
MGRDKARQVTPQGVVEVQHAPLLSIRRCSRGHPVDVALRLCHVVQDTLQRLTGVERVGDELEDFPLMCASRIEERAASRQASCVGYSTSLYHWPCRMS